MESFLVYDRTDLSSRKVYVNMGEAEVARHARFIAGFNPEDQAAYMRN